MNSVRFLRAASLALAVFVCFGIAYAQSDLGSISGFVKDPSGAVVPGAQVTVKNDSTGTERNTKTNESGYYTVTNIPAGLYTVSAEAKGFKKFDTTSNKLDPSAALAVDVTLTVGQATETVEVSATAQVLQTESATRESLVTRQQIDLLELNGRNPVNLSVLAPGARPGNASGLSFNFSQGPSNFNGSRNPENLITYDGAPATRTRSNGTSLGAADVDSTQEVQVLTAAYAAEYGRTSGAQIRILTRARRPSTSTARRTSISATTTSTPTPGRAITRPIFPDCCRTAPCCRSNTTSSDTISAGPSTFPGSSTRTNRSSSGTLARSGSGTATSTPRPGLCRPRLMRQGNFSELLTNTPTNILGRVVQLVDPNTKNPIPGNLIPATLQSPNGLGILKAYPVADIPIGAAGGTNNYYVTAKHPQNQRKETFAVDMNLTDKQRLQFRKNDYAFWEYQPLDGTPTETPKYFNRPEPDQFARPCLDDLAQQGE